MLRIIFLGSLFLIMNSLFGQGESLSSKAVADKFESFYNAGKADSIFSMFSEEMKRAFPPDKTNEFLNGLDSDAGKITKRVFVKYGQGYACYKTNFERALYTVNISIDENEKIKGLLVKAFTDEHLPMMDRNTSKLTLPFKGTWTVFWGGDTKEQNYHIESQAQKNAFDFFMLDEEEKSFKGSGAKNTDYYAFGKELYAPCNGEVVLVVDGVKDNEPGTLNPVYVPGNTVIIKTANEEYLFFAHFKQHSIEVREGQLIKREQLLGLCGNSGNSSQPHLHFHIQNVEDMNVATGVKCYFDDLLVNGHLKKNYSPVKGDKIKRNF